MKNIPLIGVDPEVFLFDKKQKHFVSAAGYFPGTKSAPHEVELGAIQVDGISLEFNIAPANNEDTFFHNVSTVHFQMEKMVKDVNPDWDIVHTPVVKISKAIWETVPDDAKELGCDPDYNLKGAANPNPTSLIEKAAKSARVGAIRTGSGHFHIGFSKDENPEDAFHFEDCRFVAEKFHTKGVFTPMTNLEWQRLKYYGGNAAFRPKTYGVELRSPSNTWLGPNNMLSEQNIREAYRKVVKTFQEITA